MSEYDESSSENEDPSNGGGSQPGGGNGSPGDGADSFHVPVSSEGGGGGNSGEGGEGDENEVSVDQVAESFDGEMDGGELESVAGFEYGRAFGEGMPTEIITDDLLELSEMTPEGFPAESVCGRDDRIQVGNTTSPPWRWICKLIITFPNGRRGGCTGWFIGRRAVMTAGHCVYSRANGGWARSIEVIPGMRGASRPYGSMVGTSFRSVTGWTNSGNPNYDYGCIILPSPALGNRVGYFGFASLTNASLRNLLVNNSGYAGDKPFGTQWFNAGRITNTSSRKLYYMLDTFGGQSGSPTWRYRNGQRHAVGIHAYGGCPNSSTRIVRPVFNNMLAWRSI